MKEDDVVVVSSDSEEDEENVWMRKNSNQHYQLLLEKIKPILYYQVQPGHKLSDSFPYARFAEYAKDLKKSLSLVSVKSTQAFIWKNIIRWLVSMKLCFESVSDLIDDRNYNLILTDFMAQYVDYKCQLHSLVTDETEVGLISNEIVLTLSLIFSGWVPGILMTLLKIRVIDDYRLILYPIFRKYLSNKRLHETNDLIPYLRLILCFRKWKKLAHLKEDKEIINEIAVGKSAKALRSDSIDLSSDIDHVLPKTVPLVDDNNRAFATITSLIGFASNNQFGTRILLINRSLELDETIEEFFTQYKAYINRDTPKLLEWSRVDLKPVLIEDLTRSPSPDQLLPGPSSSNQAISQIANKNNGQQGTTAVNQHLSSDCDISRISINNKFNNLNLNSHNVENLSPSCKNNHPQSRNNDVELRLRMDNVVELDDTDEDDDNDDDENYILAVDENSKANHGNVFERKVTDTLDRLKVRAVTVENLVNRVNVERVNNPDIAVISSDEEGPSNVDVPVNQAASNCVEPPISVAENPLPIEKPIQKRRCEHGIVSSTTSFDCASTPDGVASFELPETTRDANTPISDDDDGFGVPNRFSILQRSSSKVVEEATSSTNEIPKRTQPNVIFSVHVSNARRSISSSPCSTRPSSPSPDACSNISPSSTIRSRSINPPIAADRTISSMADGERPTCSRFVSKAVSTASLSNKNVRSKKVIIQTSDNLKQTNKDPITSKKIIESIATATSIPESRLPTCSPYALTSDHTTTPRSEVPIIDKSTVPKVDENTCATSDLLKSISGFIGDSLEECGFESPKEKCGPDKSRRDISETPTNESNDNASFEVIFSQSESKEKNDDRKSTDNCKISFQIETNEKAKSLKNEKLSKEPNEREQSSSQSAKANRFIELQEKITPIDNNINKADLRKIQPACVLTDKPEARSKGATETVANFGALKSNEQSFDEDDMAIETSDEDTVSLIDKESNSNTVFSESKTVNMSTTDNESIVTILETENGHEQIEELIKAKNEFNITNEQITNKIDSSEGCSNTQKEESINKISNAQNNLVTEKPNESPDFSFVEVNNSIEIEDNKKLDVNTMNNEDSLSFSENLNDKSKLFVNDENISLNEESLQDESNDDEIESPDYEPICPSDRKPNEDTETNSSSISNEENLKLTETPVVCSKTNSENQDLDHQYAANTPVIIATKCNDKEKSFANDGVFGKTGEQIMLKNTKAVDQLNETNSAKNIGDSSEKIAIIKISDTDFRNNCPSHEQVSFEAEENQKANDKSQKCNKKIIEAEEIVETKEIVENEKLIVGRETQTISKTENLKIEQIINSDHDYVTARSDRFKSVERTYASSKGYSSEILVDQEFTNEILENIIGNKITSNQEKESNDREINEFSKLLILDEKCDSNDINKKANDYYREDQFDDDLTVIYDTISTDDEFDDKSVVHDDNATKEVQKNQLAENDVSKNLSETVDLNIDDQEVKDQSIERKQSNEEIENVPAETLNASTNANDENQVLEKQTFNIQEIAEPQSTKREKSIDDFNCKNELTVNNEKDIENIHKEEPLKIAPAIDRSDEIIEKQILDVEENDVGQSVSAKTETSIHANVNVDVKELNVQCVSNENYTENKQEPINLVLPIETVEKQTLDVKTVVDCQATAKEKSHDEGLLSVVDKAPDECQSVSHDTIVTAVETECNGENILKQNKELISVIGDTKKTENILTINKELTSVIGDTKKTAIEQKDETIDKQIFDSKRTDECQSTSTKETLDDTKCNNEIELTVKNNGETEKIQNKGLLNISLEIDRKDKTIEKEVFNIKETDECKSTPKEKSHDESFISVHTEDREKQGLVVKDANECQSASIIETVDDTECTNEDVVNVNSEDETKNIQNQELLNTSLAREKKDETIETQTDECQSTIKDKSHDESLSLVDTELSSKNVLTIKNEDDTEIGKNKDSSPPIDCKDKTIEIKTFDVKETDDAKSYDEIPTPIDIELIEEFIPTVNNEGEINNSTKPLKVFRQKDEPIETETENVNDINEHQSASGKLSCNTAIVIQLNNEKDTVTEDMINPLNSSSATDKQDELIELQKIDVEEINEMQLDVENVTPMNSAPSELNLIIPVGNKDETQNSNSKLFNISPVIEPFKDLIIDLKETDMQIKTYGKTTPKQSLPQDVKITNDSKDEKDNSKLNETLRIIENTNSKDTIKTKLSLKLQRECENQNDKMNHDEITNSLISTNNVFELQNKSCSSSKIINDDLEIRTSKNESSSLSWKVTDAVIKNEPIRKLRIRIKKQNLEQPKKGKELSVEYQIVSEKSKQNTLKKKKLSKDTKQKKIQQGNEDNTNQKPNAYVQNINLDQSLSEQSSSEKIKEEDILNASQPIDSKVKTEQCTSREISSIENATLIDTELSVKDVICVHSQDDKEIMNDKPLNILPAIDQKVEAVKKASLDVQKIVEDQSHTEQASIITNDQDEITPTKIKIANPQDKQNKELSPQLHHSEFEVSLCSKGKVNLSTKDLKRSSLSQEVLNNEADESKIATDQKNVLPTQLAQSESSIKHLRIRIVKVDAPECLTTSVGSADSKKAKKHKNKSKLRKQKKNISVEEKVKELIKIPISSPEEQVLKSNTCDTKEPLVKISINEPILSTEQKLKRDKKEPQINDKPQSENLEPKEQMSVNMEIVKNCTGEMISECSEKTFDIDASASVEKNDEKEILKNDVIPTKASGKKKNDSPNISEATNCSPYVVQPTFSENSFQPVLKTKASMKQSIKTSTEGSPNEAEVSYVNCTLSASKPLKDSVQKSEYNCKIIRTPKEIKTSVKRSATKKDAKSVECQTEPKQTIVYKPPNNDPLSSDKQLLVIQNIVECKDALIKTRNQDVFSQIRDENQENGIEPDSTSQVAKELQKTVDTLADESNLSTRVQIDDLEEPLQISDSEIEIVKNSSVRLESDSAVVYYPSRDSIDDEIVNITSQNLNSNPPPYYNDENGTPVMDEKTEDETSQCSESKITCLSAIKVPTADESLLIAPTQKPCSEPLKVLLKRRSNEGKYWDSSSKPEDLTFKPVKVSVDNIQEECKSHSPDGSVTLFSTEEDENLELWKKKLGISKNCPSNKGGLNLRVSNLNTHLNTVPVNEDLQLLTNFTKKSSISSLKNDRKQKNPRKVRFLLEPDVDNRSEDQKSLNSEDFSAAAILTSFKSVARVNPIKIKTPKEKSSRKKDQPTRFIRNTRSTSSLMMDEKLSESANLCVKDPLDLTSSASIESHNELTQTAVSSDSDDTGKLVIDFDVEKSTKSKANKKTKSKGNNKGKGKGKGKGRGGRTKKSEEVPSKISQDTTTTTTTTKSKRETAQQKKNGKCIPIQNCSLDQSVKESKVHSINKEILPLSFDVALGKQVALATTKKRNKKLSLSFSFESSKPSVSRNNMNKEAWLENFSLRKTSKSLDTELKEPSQNVSKAKRILSEPNLSEYLKYSSITEIEKLQSSITCVGPHRKRKLVEEQSYKIMSTTTTEKISEDILKETNVTTAEDQTKPKPKHELHEKGKRPRLQVSLKDDEKKIETSSSQKEVRSDESNNDISILAKEKEEADKPKVEMHVGDNKLETTPKQSKKQIKKTKRKKEETKVLEDQTASITAKIFTAVLDEESKQSKGPVNVLETVNPDLGSMNESVNQLNDSIKISANETVSLPEVNIDEEIVKVEQKTEKVEEIKNKPSSVADEQVSESIIFNPLVKISNLNKEDALTPKNTKKSTEKPTYKFADIVESADDSLVKSSSSSDSNLIEKQVDKNLDSKANSNDQIIIVGMVESADDSLVKSSSDSTLIEKQVDKNSDSKANSNDQIIFTSLSEEPSEKIIEEPVLSNPIEKEPKSESSVKLKLEPENSIDSKNDNAELHATALTVEQPKTNESNCEILKEDQILQEPIVSKKSLIPISIGSNFDTKNISDTKKLGDYNVNVPKPIAVKTPTKNDQDDVKRVLDIFITNILGPKLTDVSDIGQNNVEDGERKMDKKDQSEERLKKEVERIPKRKESYEINSETLPNKSERESKKTSCVMSFTDLEFEKDWSFLELNPATQVAINNKVEPRQSEGDKKSEQFGFEDPDNPPRQKTSVKASDCMLSGNRGQEDEDKLHSYNIPSWTSVQNFDSPGDIDEPYQLFDGGLCLFDQLQPALINGSENVSGGNSDGSDKPKIDGKNAEFNQSEIDTIDSSDKSVNSSRMVVAQLVQLSTEKSLLNKDSGIKNVSNDPSGSEIKFDRDTTLPEILVNEDIVPTTTSEHTLNESTTKLVAKALAKITANMENNKKIDATPEKESPSKKAEESKLKSRSKPFWKQINQKSDSSISISSLPIDDVKSLPDLLDEMFEDNQIKTPLNSLDECKNNVDETTKSDKMEASKKPHVNSSPTDDLFDRLKNESPVNKLKPLLKQSISTKTDDNSASDSCLRHKKPIEIISVTSMPSISTPSPSPQISEFLGKKDETKTSPSSELNSASLSVKTTGSHKPIHETQKTDLDSKATSLKQIDENAVQLEIIVSPEDNNPYSKKPSRQSRFPANKKHTIEEIESERKSKDVTIGQKTNCKDVTSNIAVVSPIPSISKPSVSPKDPCEQKNSVKISLPKKLLTQSYGVKASSVASEKLNEILIPENKTVESAKISLKRTASDDNKVQEPPSKIVCSKITVTSKEQVSPSTSTKVAVPDASNLKPTRMSPKSDSLVLLQNQKSVVTKKSIQSQPIQNQLTKLPTLAFKSVSPASNQKPIERKSRSDTSSPSSSSARTPARSHDGTNPPKPHTTIPSSKLFTSSPLSGQKHLEPAFKLSSPSSQSPRNYRAEHITEKAISIRKSTFSNKPTHFGTPNSTPSWFGTPRSNNIPSSTPRSTANLVSSSSRIPSPLSMEVARVAAELEKIQKDISKLPEVDLTFPDHKRRKFLHEQFENKQNELKGLKEKLQQQQQHELKKSNDLKKKQQELEKHALKSYSERKPFENDHHQQHHNHHHHNPHHRNNNDLKRKPNDSTHSLSQFSAGSASVQSSHGKRHKTMRREYVNKFSELDKLEHHQFTFNKNDTTPKAKTLPPWDPKPLNADEIIQKLRLK